MILLEFQSLFDDTWDMAYLSREDTFQASMSPIKAKYHVFGRDFTNGIHFPDITHGIVMCKFGESWDYSFYKEIINTIKKAILWVGIQCTPTTKKRLYLVD